MRTKNLNDETAENIRINASSNRKLKRIILLFLIMLWMTIVFLLSNQNGNESSSLSGGLVRFFSKSNESIQITEAVIRKLAHLIEYVIGGVLFLLFFFTYGISEDKKMIFSELLCMEYAIIDEIHQFFIDGRNCNIIDIIIDSIGSALGICCFLLIYKIMFERKKYIE